MNDHEFNAAYGSDAHSIVLLLREVNAGFLYDVVSMYIQPFGLGILS